MESMYYEYKLTSCKSNNPVNLLEPSSNNRVVNDVLITDNKGNVYEESRYVNLYSKS